MNITETPPLALAARIPLYTNTGFSSETSSGLYLSIGTLAIYFCVLLIYICCPPSSRTFRVVRRESSSEIILNSADLSDASIVEDLEQQQQQRRRQLELLQKKDLAAQIIIKTVVSSIKRSVSKISASMRRNSSSTINFQSTQEPFLPTTATLLANTEERDNYDSISQSNEKGLYRNNMDSKYVNDTCNEKNDNIKTYKKQQSNNKKEKYITRKSSSQISCGTLRNKHASSVCAICLNGYKVGEHIASSCNLNCIHCFHEDCILEWLVRTKNKSCPACRREFLSLKKYKSESNECLLNM